MDAMTHALTVLRRHIGMEYLFRHIDRTDSRRKIREMVRAVRVLATVDNCPDDYGVHTGRHEMPDDCPAANRHRAMMMEIERNRLATIARQQQAEREAYWSSLTDAEVADIARRPITSFSSSVGIQMHLEARQEANRRGLVSTAPSAARPTSPG